LYDPVSGRLFHQSETALEYQQVRTRQSRNSWATFSNPVDACEIPTSALPATVIPGQNPMMTGFSELIQTDGTHLTDTFLSFLSGINAEARWVVQNVEIVGNWENWAREGEHRLQGVSDGSFKDRFGTAAFILVSPDDPTLYIKGMVITPGRPEDQNAYRSELAGMIYAITVIQWAVQKFYRLQSGQIEVACDGRSALQ
jgi:hypothetical protein